MEFITFYIIKIGAINSTHSLTHSLVNH